LWIGQNEYGYSFDGYFDEIRISDSCRYPSGTTFTPTTTEFTTDSNTMLLIHSNWDGGLGADSSGNYNTFTPTNLVATDQMKDSPTNNFCTLNPLNKGTVITTSEGNLAYTQSASWSGITGTLGMTSGKWYFELRRGDSNGTGTGSCLVGVAVLDYVVSTEPADGVANAWRYRDDGTKRYDEGTGQSYGATWTEGDIIGVAVDMENSAIYFAKNNTWQDSGDPTSGATATGAAYTSLTGTVVPVTGFYDADGNTNINFGQDSSFAGTETAQGNQDGNSIGDFYYEPPSGYLALCTSNLSNPSIKLPGDHFNTVLYTGDASNPKTVSGVGFSADMVWLKSRNIIQRQNIYDTVRGIPKSGSTDVPRISPNDSSAESDTIDELRTVTSDGFTVDSSRNGSGNTYAAWNWLAATTFDPTTAGTVTTASGRSNSDSGFSIVTYDGTGSSMTIGHGLSEAPNIIFIKRTDASGSWIVGSDGMTSWSYVISLDDTQAESENSTNIGTAPSSTVFTVNSNDKTNNSSGNYVAYCFHSVEGYSKAGSSYEGNGNADGTFIYTGFRPSYFLVKNVDSVEGWNVWDNKRSTYNSTWRKLSPNTDAAEYVASETIYAIDFLSNGVKLRTTYSAVNEANTFLFMAFAESPFKYANAR